MTLQRAVVIALLTATAACAGSPHEPHAHDATSHRSFADATYWSTVFDDPKRDAWQRPDAIVSALDLRPGMVVADLGAGTGYLSRRLATAVGATGTVLAVEVEPSLVAYLRDRAEREQTPTVIPVLASKNDPRLPVGRVDRVLVLDTWHHLDDRLAYVARLRRALAPGGRLVVVDWKPGPTPVGPPEDHKLPRATVERECTAAGLRLVDAPDLLPHQYLLVFE